MEAHTYRFGRRPAQISLVATFLGGVFLPLLHLLFVGASDAESFEQRQLAELPALPETAQEVRAYPLRFEAYFNDRFGLRERFIRWYHLAQVKWLGTPVQRGDTRNLLAGAGGSSEVIVGQEGWLFYSGEGVIDDYRCTKPFQPEELAAWGKVLQERHDWLAARGIRYLVVVVPNKHTIYGRYLPPAVRKIGDESRLDQLAAHLQSHTTVEFVDIRPALFAADGTCRTYSKTDTHWNEFGAYVGYVEMMKRLEGSWEGSTPLPLSDFNVVRKEDLGGDEARMLSLRDLLREEKISLEPVRGRQAKIRFPKGLDKLGWARIDDSPLPKAVVFHDSFFQQAARFFSEHFSHVDYVWTRDFRPAVVEQAAPLVVVQEYGERLLQSQAPTNPPELHETAPPRWAGRDEGGLRR